MFDSSVIAPILSSGIGLVGALVAGLSVYFNYKGRHNQFRQVVYGRQMDAYFEITAAMGKLYTGARNLVPSNGCWLNEDDARTRLRVSLREEHESFTATVNRWLIVIPSKVKTAVEDFNNTLLAISGPTEGHGRDGRGTQPADEPPNAEGDLTRAYERAINCIRHHLAIDSLTRGMLKEMGIGNESVTLKSVRPRVNPMVPVRRAPR
jgi:hypothetical protein